MEGLSEEEGEEVKHHIFVMHTTEAEETQLITIAEPTSAERAGQDSAEVSCEDCVTLMASVGVLRGHARHCTAVSCEDCRTLLSSVEVVRGHMRHCKGHQNLSMAADWLMDDGVMSHNSNSSHGRNSDDSGEGDEGSRDSEVVVSDMDHHTVTISEDVTITSLPLSQLPPIHLQLESDYMVVLREPGGGDASDRTLPSQQVEEHSLAESEEENSQPRLALVSSLLNG
ncbi:hypothetical protein GWK47_005356 [Chionoecetes opilio]|uniref:Uncharacterized protein n=1 Tax=Chionoecetes opilio TaxID=41210 RepID=A0A8J5CWN5_CHIOP|nr:hypothetical protein GWK47_005356 [Chionoecetes opilio]